VPDRPAEDRTEAPTPKRREKAREEGHVFRSRELNSVAMLFAGIFALHMIGADLLSAITAFMTETYQSVATAAVTPTTLPALVHLVVDQFTPLMIPFLTVLVLVGIGVNFAQVGVVFARKALIPKFSRLNPLQGIRRLFAVRSLVELLKGLGKIAIVGWVAYLVLKRHLDSYWLLSNVPAAKALALLGEMLLELAIKIGVALIFLGIADYAYQRWEYEKSLKMSKQEIKDEQKQHEGNPEIKGRIRSIQRQLARKRMMAAVPDATVVVTNPTEIAVALKYAPVNKSDAPVVVAKGQRKIAVRIKAIAREHGVPVIENRPLARTLHETTEVGMEIPEVLYQAVAELLVQVYQMNQPSTPSFKHAYAG
jgi:flagellar biosynthetic protein FlhB